jgi:hypothetical protein
MYSMNSSKTLSMTEKENVSSPNYRALCAELTNELHGYASANPHHDSDALVARAARRPKPPSLKEQASESLDKVVECLTMLVPGASDGIHIKTIRRALEQLND